MDIDRTLLENAHELVKLMDKTADSMLPSQIVNVVKMHSKMAVASAWIPVPGADLAAGVAAIWGMYVRINEKIGIPFGENVMKSIGSGVATNLASYVAMSGVASVIKFIPGIGSIGGAVLMSAAQYALTLTSGYVYLRALQVAARRKGKSISGSDISEAVKSVLSDKGAIGRFFSESKSSYRK